MTAREQIGIAVVKLIHYERTACACESTGNRSTDQPRKAGAIEQLFQAFVLAAIQQPIDVVKQVVDILDCSEEISRRQPIRQRHRQFFAVDDPSVIDVRPLDKSRHPGGMISAPSP